MTHRPGPEEPEEPQQLEQPRQPQDAPELECGAVRVAAVEVGEGVLGVAEG